MFGRARAGIAEHPGAISLNDRADLTDDYFELARVWVSPERGRSYCLVGRPQDWQPALLGSLLAESIETAATAYAEVEGVAREDALREIWRGLDEHRAAVPQPSQENE